VIAIRRITPGGSIREHVSVDQPVLAARFTLERSAASRRADTEAREQHRRRGAFFAVIEMVSLAHVV
jgi:hypothetical protein